MIAKSFEGPPTPNDMVAVVDSAVAEGKAEAAYLLAAAMLDYHQHSPYRHDHVWMYGFDYWLGVRAVLGMQRAVRAGKRARKLARSA